MSSDANCGQVTIIPLEKKNEFHTHSTTPTYVPLMPNGPACAIRKRLERAISCMWLWLALIPQQCWKEYRKQNTKLLLKLFLTECNEMEETIKLHGNNR